jgi:ribosomal protein S18 acetylase RimI-like enzyme
MTKEYSIRTATKNDLSLLQSLGIRTFSETFSQYNTAENMRLYLEKSFSRQQIEAELDDPSAVFLLAYDDDVTAGYARLRQGTNAEGLNSVNALEIERIYAVQEYIGKQAGRRLMDACIGYATEKGFDTLWLGVWEHNARAVRFYEKYGFEKFGEHVFMLGSDAQTDWLMKKTL